MWQTGKSTLFSGHERLVQRTIEMGHSETKIHPLKQITLAYVPSPKISSRNQGSYLERKPFFFVYPRAVGPTWSSCLNWTGKFTGMEGRILALQRCSGTHDMCCDLAKAEILAVNGIKVVIQTLSGIYGVSRYNQGITGALQGTRSGWNALRRAWLLDMNAEGESHERRDPERTRGWQGNRTTIPMTY